MNEEMWTDPKLNSSWAELEVIAKKFAFDYVNHIEDHYADYASFHLVWFSKTLQNWKALVMCEKVPLYFEVTYNGVKDTTYIDVYRKKCNLAIKDGKVVEKTDL